MANAVVVSFRKIEDLLNDLSSSSQNLAKAKENYEVLQQEKDREIQEAKQNFEGIIAKLQDQVKELVSIFCVVDIVSGFFKTSPTMLYLVVLYGSKALDLFE